MPGRARHVILVSLILVAGGIAAAIPTVAAAGSEERRPMTVEDLWAMQRVGSPSLSPDGRQVAFTVSAFSMEDNKGNSDLWVVPYAGGAPRRLTYNEGTDNSPASIPDGRSRAFVSKRGEVFSWLDQYIGEEAAGSAADGDAAAAQ